MQASDFDQNMALRREGDGALLWRSAKEGFGLCGSDALFEEGYCRLTEAERAYVRPVNDGEAWFGEQPSGIRAQFETDSLRIDVRVRLAGPFDMTNMTQTGQCGMDLYVYDEEMGDYVLHEVARYPFPDREYTVPLLHFTERKMRRYLLYFPLYRAVERCEIGLEPSASLRPISCAPLRIGIYGTSITQGCSASRPGMAYTNILSRRLGCEVLNFGFSGVAFMEREMAELLGERKLDLLIVDTEPNAGVDERLRDRAEDFLRAFLAGSLTTRVLLFSRVLFALDRYDGARRELCAFYRDFLRKLCTRMRRSGAAVYFADGGRIFPGNYTEYTADGVHPSDAGMIAIANTYQREIARVMGKISK